MHLLRALCKQREQGRVGGFPRQQRRGGCHHAHVPRWHVAGQVHHTPGQGDRGEEGEPPRVGLVLGNVEQLHAGGLQQHLHHQRFGGRGKHQCVQLARQEGDGGRRFFQPGHGHGTRLQPVGFQQLVHEPGHATAFRAHVHAHAAQLPQPVQPGALVHALGGFGAVEHPHRLHKQAAQRHQVFRVVRQQLGGAALHKGQVCLPVAQQLKVGR